MAIPNALAAISLVFETYPLPEDIRLWEFPEPYLNAHQTIFPVIGPSGGLRAEWAAYLVKRDWPDGSDMGTNGLSEHENARVYAIPLLPSDTHETVTHKIKEAIEALNGN
jgi:hypothetical protein